LGYGLAIAHFATLIVVLLVIVAHLNSFCTLAAQKQGGNAKKDDMSGYFYKGGYKSADAVAGSEFRTSDSIFVFQ